MALPLLTTWVALLNTSLFATLSGINACLYAVDFWRKQDRLALPCAFFSAAAVLASLPLGTMDWIWPDINRSRMIFAGISAYWLAVSLYSRNPWAAFPGAIVSMYLAGLSSSGSNFVVFRVIQTGLVFVLFHSLRWEETADKAVRHFRTTISVLWAINSIWWSGQDAGSLWFLTGTASVVLAFCCIIRWLTKDWPSKVVVLVAGLNLAMIFSIHGTRKVQSVSPDMWAIIAAFMLFVLGTGFAIAKHRWQRERKMN